MTFTIGQEVVVVQRERYGRQLKPPMIYPAVVAKVGRRWCTLTVQAASHPYECRFDLSDARWPMDAGGFHSEARVFLSEASFRASHELMLASGRLAKAIQRLRHTTWDAERWATKMACSLSAERIRAIAVELGLGDAYDEDSN